MQLDTPSWAEFEAAFRKRWQQGEHVFISAQTGAGKTEILLKIMALRTYGVIAISKPKDPILKSADARQYRKVATFAPQSHDHRLMVVPPMQRTSAEMAAVQYDTFSEMLDSAFRQGGWTIGFDELAYMAEDLRLERPIKRISHMGRAMGITAVSVTQRPFRIPVIVRTSATHAFLGPTARDEDLRALGQLGFDTKATRAAIVGLTGEHDFVYVDQRRRLPMVIVNTRRAR